MTEFLAVGFIGGLALFLLAVTVIFVRALVGTVWMVVAMVRGVVVPRAQARDRWQSALRDTW